MPQNSWRTQEMNLSQEILTKKISKESMPKNSWRTHELSFFLLLYSLVTSSHNLFKDILCDKKS